MFPNAPTFIGWLLPGTQFPINATENCSVTTLLFTSRSNLIGYVDYENVQHMNSETVGRHYSNFTMSLNLKVESRYKCYATLAHKQRIGNDSDETLPKLSIRAAAKLHPDMVLMCKSFLDKNWKSGEIAGKNAVMEEYIRMFLNVTGLKLPTSIETLGLKSFLPIFQPKEMEILQNTLEERKRTAIILSSIICREMKCKLEANREIPQVFVGEETYLDIDWIFVLVAHVPPCVIKRIRMVGESGIWVRWVNLLGESHLDGSKFQGIHTATMDWNIVVVFGAWSIGIAISVIQVLKELIFSSECYPWHLLKGMVQWLSRCTLKSISTIQMDYIKP